MFPGSALSVFERQFDSVGKGVQGFSSPRTIMRSDESVNVRSIGSDKQTKKEVEVGEEYLKMNFKLI